eukprot:7620478-Heterocapsa_arctica.AAC.1
MHTASFRLAVRAFPGFGSGIGQFGFPSRRPGATRNNAGKSAEGSLDFATPAFPREPKGRSLINSPLSPLEIGPSIPYLEPPVRCERMVQVPPSLFPIRR